MYIMEFFGLQTPQQIHPAHVGVRCALYFLSHITRKAYRILDQFIYLCVPRPRCCTGMRSYNHSESS